MGMYTKYMGILNIESITATAETIQKENKELNNLIEWYSGNQITPRSWVIESLRIVDGLNGCIAIAFCGEIKNYHNDIQMMIDFVLEKYPTAEGVITTQYEEDESPTVMFVSKGKIVQTSDVKEVEFNGYGNGCGYSHDKGWLND